MPLMAEDPAMTDESVPPGEHLLDEDARREILASLHPHTRRRRFRKGERLWREGDSEGLLVSLVSGQVKIYRVSPVGAVVTLFLFGPGTTFGFMPFLDGGPYPASAEALTDVVADVISREALLPLFATDPTVALFLVRQLASRLRNALENLTRQAFHGALPRVAGALLGLLDGAAPVGGRGRVELPVSARELALSVGVQPETFSRAVTRLVEAGTLRRLGARRFEVVNEAALRALAGGGGT